MIGFAGCAIHSPRNAHASAGWQTLIPARYPDGLLDWPGFPLIGYLLIPMALSAGFAAASAF
jgi:hypothetical protein